MNSVGIGVIALAQRERIGDIVTGGMGRVVVHGRSQHAGHDHRLPNRHLLPQLALNRQDAVGVGSGLLRQEREHAGVGHAAVGSTEERIPQFAVTDLVRQCEHRLSATVDAAIQEAVQWLERLDRVGRNAHDALDMSAFDARHRQRPALRVTVGDFGVRIELRCELGASPHRFIR